MIVFAPLAYYESFARFISAEFPNAVVGSCDIGRFPNGEMHVRIHEDVSNQDCLVIGSLAPPDEQLLGLLMLIDTLAQGGAHLVRVFLPYLGYGRQDKFEPGESRGIALMGALLRASGADEVTTIDVHSKLDQKLIGLPLTSLSPSSLFTPAVQGLGWDDITIVAPDEGAIARAQAMADSLGAVRPVAHLAKKHVDGIVHLSLVGEVSERVVIIDDIIDSGRTLISACNVLREKGVKEIVIVVTHGLFTGTAWQRLFDLGVKVLLVSDSCPEALRQKHPDVQVISFSPLLPAILPITAGREKKHESVIS